MTTPTADPPPLAPAAAGSAAAGGGVDPAPATTTRPARPAPRGLLAATAIIATIGVVVALFGLVLLLRPVSTPTQDCGTSLGFLIDGRVNVFVSEDAPPAGITPEEARANNAEPCRVRVADQTKPAAVLLLAGLVAALLATLVEVVVRSSAWLRRRRLQRTAPSDPTAPPAPADPAAPAEISGRTEPPADPST